MNEVASQDLLEEEGAAQGEEHAFSRGAQGLFMLFFGFFKGECSPRFQTAG